jgi:hypothetical protein
MEINTLYNRIFIDDTIVRESIKFTNKFIFKQIYPIFSFTRN